MPSPLESVPGAAQPKPNVRKTLDTTHEGDRFWIALSYAGDGPQENPAQWVISVDYSAGLNLIRRLFHNPQQAFALLRDRIWQSLRSNTEIKVIGA